MAETDDEASQAGNPAAREFVASKKAWTACLKTAGKERACGRKPHPHDFARKHEKKHDKKHRLPMWAGGPHRRTAEPPGHARRD